MSSSPHLYMGAGGVESLHRVLSGRGFNSVLLVISRSVMASERLRSGVLGAMELEGISVRTYRYDRLPDDADPFSAPRGPHAEPNPSVVDAITERERSLFADSPADVVVAIGGGSAVDTGKAVSAALRHPGSIQDYLEGVGTRKPSGAKVPFVAVPTTAGTGSEATKNAVLSAVGADGFKKSLRHDRFVPDIAVIDPLLQTGCPPDVTAATGMDAISQLLEAYLSTGANPLTDALALEGLRTAGRSFIRAVERGESDIDARAGMAYAAYLSGICLANAGLGVVHGLAGPAGGHASVPHGAFCGVLLAPAVEMLSERARRSDRTGDVMARLGAAGQALAGKTAVSVDDGLALLTDRIREFTRIGSLSGLAAYGFDDSMIRMVAREGDSKSCPVQFGESERAELLQRAL